MKVPVINCSTINRAVNASSPFAEAMLRSKEALNELSGESFNSGILKTLMSPEFKPKNPNCMMAVSAAKPYRPVEVGYTLEQDGRFVALDIFTKDDVILGQKTYTKGIDRDGNMKMGSLHMSSDEQACEMAGVKGIGTIERILQIRDAIQEGITKIPCTSYAKAVLFHLKMGFLPVPELKRVNTMSEVDKLIKEMTERPSAGISPQNYTPIIVSKGKSNPEYFLDVNTTECLADLRQIKQDYINHPECGVRPSIKGQCVEMLLEGQNFETWRDIIVKIFAKE